MDMNPKAIAERILKLSSDIEKEAAEKTYYVCQSCNHTATLSTINSRRAKVASSKGISKVNPVTVNDKVGCPACDGEMSYVATEESKKYYVEAGVDILDAMDLVNSEKKKKEDTFEPVDEQPKPEGEEGVPELDLSFGEDVLDKSPEEEKPEGAIPMDDKAPPMDDKAHPIDDKTPPMDYDTPEGKPEDMPKMDEGAPEDKPEDVPPMDEGAPEEKPEEVPEMDESGKPPKMDESAPEMPTDEDTGETPPIGEEAPRGTSLEEPPAEGMESPPVEEEEPLPVEDKPKKKKKDKEVTDIPKFEKMPKDASEDFQRALRKYASAF